MAPRTIPNDRTLRCHGNKKKHTKVLPLTGREEPGDSGASHQVRRNAAAEVVRRWHHGQGLHGHVQPVPQAVLVDGREAAADPVRWSVGDVEVHVRGPLETHLAEDGPAHHVPRGELHDCLMEFRTTRGYIARESDHQWGDTLNLEPAG